MTRFGWFGLWLGALSGCEEGCLSAWLAERGIGERPREEALDLTGTDCSDGLARCQAGVVEVSRTAHVPASCAGAGCSCPWEVAGRCPAGCAEESLVVAAEPGAARVQLCRPEAPIARPLFAGEGSALAPREICAAEGTDCVGGILRACEAPGRPAAHLGACLHGCAVAVALDPGARATADGAAAILCRRADAERR